MDLGKLFIGGISWDTNEEHLREYFQNFGEVLEAVIMKDRNTGRARGFGFVVFADPAVAERVVTEKHVIDGRTVEAKKAVPRDDQQSLNRSSPSIHGSPGPVRTKKIFVGGLASTVTESDFRRYFDQFGTITDVVVMYDHNTQRPRGFGFITYDSEEAVDQVLLKTFHELNGKMVEVKRAVPKELSPGPSRGQLGGFNHSPIRVRNFINGYANQNPLAGGYDVGMDGRFSPVTVGRGGYSPIAPSGYGMGLNFQAGLNPGYGGNTNFSSNTGYGRVLNLLFNGNSNRYGPSLGHAGDYGGNGSLSSSNPRSLWGNENLNYASNSTNSSAFLGSRIDNSGVDSFGSIGAIWGSPSSGQVGGSASAYNSDNISQGSESFNFGPGRGGYRRNSGTNFPLASAYAPSNRSFDGTNGDFYEDASFYSDPTWRSASSELEGTGRFGYGLRSAGLDIASGDSADFIDGYSVANR